MPHKIATEAQPATMNKATTKGIGVEVQSIYLEEHSDPSEPRFVFAYNIEISNQGDAPAMLEARHWIITDSTGKVEEVSGPGVVGETPRLEPGESHAYQSFCVLKTPRGTMHGSYQMVRDDGQRFDAQIPTFVLSTLSDAAKLVLN